MEFLLLVLVFVVFAGVIAFFMACGHHSSINKLKERIGQLESQVNALRSRMQAMSPQTEKKPVKPPPPLPETPKPAASAIPPQPAAVSEKPKEAPVAAMKPVEAAATPIVSEKAAKSIIDLPAIPSVDKAPPPALQSERAAPPPLQPVHPATPAPEPEIERTDWEARIGKRWLTWGGVLLLVAAVGFLIKYAYDQGWIGPWTQVGIGMVVGCALCVLGDWQVRKQNMRPLGQGVMALGLTVVYLTCFGAFAFFKLEAVSQVTALALLALTSGAGVALSNRHRSLPICILSALGGYLAPILVATGKPPPVNGLFSYTLLVNLGIIIVAMIRTWPALPLLAFAGTIVHFWGWHYKFYVPEQAVQVAVWASIFHFTFLVLPALPLLRGARVTPWQWLLPVFNAVAGVWVVWRHLYHPHPLALMLVLLGMAAVHLGIGMWKLRGAEDKVARGVYIAIGLAVATLAPLAWFGVQANLICWLVLGLLLVELGCRMRFPLFHIFGFGDLALGLVWCVFKLTLDFDAVELPVAAFLGLRDFSARWALSEYGGVENFLAALFSFDIFWTRLLAPAALGVCILLLHRWREQASDKYAAAKSVCTFAALFFGISFVARDVNAWMWFTAPEGAEAYSRAWALIPLWCAGTIVLALAGWRWKAMIPSWAGCLFLVFAAYLAGRDLYFDEKNPGSGFFLNAGYWSAMLFAATCMLACWVVGGRFRWLAAGIAGYLILFTQNIEIGKILSGRPHDEYHIFWAAALMYCAGGLAYLAIAWKAPDKRLRHCFWPPWLAGLGFAAGAMWYKDDLAKFELFPAFSTMAYLASLAVCATLFVKMWRSASGSRVGIWTGIVAGWLLLVVNHAELAYWHHGLGEGLRWDAAMYGGLWHIGLMWGVGALAFVVLAFWRKRVPFLAGAVPPLIVAGVFVHRMLELRKGLEVLPTPVLNMAFVCYLVLCLGVLLFAYASGKGRADIGLHARNFVYVVAAVLGLALLTQECHYWSVYKFGFGEEGWRVSKVAVSIVWAVYSIALLITGFTTRIRGWRLAGLALFAVTCIKLVAFDLTHLEQLHRIFAFMALGILLMASSYLYHKLEKRLQKRDG